MPRINLGAAQKLRANTMHMRGHALVWHSQVLA